MSSILQWVRPSDSPYPRVWITFKERDLNSDQMVEYRIQDVPESRFGDTINLMNDIFLYEEPIRKSFADKSVQLKECSDLWRTVLSQKVALVCFKANSNEIIGANLAYVLHKDDIFLQNFQYSENLAKSEIARTLAKIYSILYKNVDISKKYAVNQIIQTMGLSVAHGYRGRRIGQRLLEATELFGNAFGIKGMHSVFSSDYSNRIADTLGFQTDAAYSFEELANIDSTLKLGNIESSGIALRTWIF